MLNELESDSPTLESLVLHLVVMIENRKYLKFQRT